MLDVTFSLFQAFHRFRAADKNVFVFLLPPETVKLMK
jgi:hypothetical protein